MLTIRRDQIALFEKDSWRRLAIDAAAHLRAHFPERCEALGESGLRSRIDAGIRLARAHGLELTYDYLRYLNLAMVFGWDFEESRSWASEILGRTEFGPHTRMDMLCQRALDELDWTEDEPVEHVPEETATGDEKLEAETLADEESHSVDGAEPEPDGFEPEEAPIVWDLDPDVDYKAHESDFRDG